jgi:glycosyltransferase involved in cell wall biosynthesis
MKVSVILCTYNRALTLEKTLYHLADSKAAFDWEVIVVDNNSSDHTGKVIDEYCRYHRDRFRHAVNLAKASLMP